jgi:hypothetical protein
MLCRDFMPRTNDAALERAVDIALNFLLSVFTVSVSEFAMTKGSCFSAISLTPATYFVVSIVTVESGMLNVSSKSRHHGKLGLLKSFFVVFVFVAQRGIRRG